MTQVELPQLSLQRYVELLKRRRWHLLPVSLAGLLIGGLVAFFIPRYFVATTLVEHEEVPGEALDRGEDPFKTIVASARATIPQAVLQTMEELRWPEAQVTDLYERIQNARDVENRLSINDANPDRGPTSTLAQLRLTYKDRDGERAAKFLNTLFDIWSRKRVDELRAKADGARKRAEDELRRWTGVREGLRKELHEIEVRYRIAPDADTQLKREAFQAREQKREERAKKLGDKQAEVDTAAKQIEVDTDRLGRMPERVPADPMNLLAMAKASPELAEKFLTVQYYTLQIENFQPGTSQLAAAKRGLARAQRELMRAMTPEGGVGRDGKLPNPEREALRKQVLAAEEALIALQKEASVLRDEIDEENRRLGEAQVGYVEWAGKNDRLQDATARRDKAAADADKQEVILARLQSRMPVTVAVKAQVPPRPTDPNILVIALIGCVLGLGAAIALILLLDFMQGSFKTIEDVERGLTVPVLGGMSHLETEDERRTTQRGRRRASLAAFGFVALVVVVVTIFYLDPTRLPPLVRDLLAMLLGKS